MQKKHVKKHGLRAVSAAGVSLVGLGALGANKSIAKNMAKDFVTSLPTNKKSARKKRIVGEGKGIYKTGDGLGIGPVGNSGYDRIPVEGGKLSSNKNGFRSIDKLAKTIAVAGLGTAAYQTGRALSAKYRTTKKGHAKAIAKRDKFKREMNNVFAGTKYGKKKRRSGGRVNG